MKLLLDFLPILFFFGTFKYAESHKDWAAAFATDHLGFIVSGGVVAFAMGADGDVIPGGFGVFEKRHEAHGVEFRRGLEAGEFEEGGAEVSDIDEGIDGAARAVALALEWSLLRLFVRQAVGLCGVGLVRLIRHRGVS